MYILMRQVSINETSADYLGLTSSNVKVFRKHK
jgi:hypothetical protein